MLLSASWAQFASPAPVSATSTLGWSNLGRLVHSLLIAITFEAKICSPYNPGPGRLGFLLSHGLVVDHITRLSAWIRVHLHRQQGQSDYPKNKNHSKADWRKTEDWQIFTACTIRTDVIRHWSVQACDSACRDWIRAEPIADRPLDREILAYRFHMAHSGAEVADFAFEPDGIENGSRY